MVGLVALQACGHGQRCTVGFGQGIDGIDAGQLEPLGQIGVHVAEQSEISRSGLIRRHGHLLRFPVFLEVGELHFGRGILFDHLGHDHFISQDGLIGRRDVKLLILRGVKSQGRAGRRPHSRPRQAGVQIVVLALERLKLVLPLLFVEVQPLLPL